MKKNINIEEFFIRIFDFGNFLFEMSLFLYWKVYFFYVSGSLLLIGRRGMFIRRKMFDVCGMIVLNVR